MTCVDRFWLGDRRTEFVFVKVNVGTHRKFKVRRTCDGKYLWKDGSWHTYAYGDGYFKSRAKAEEAIALSALTDWEGIKENNDER